MKKIFHLILVMAIATMFFSCEESEKSVKNRIYAEEHAIYSQGDSLYGYNNIYSISWRS